METRVSPRYSVSHCRLCAPRTSNPQLTVPLETLARKALKSAQRPADRKNFAGKPKATYLSVTLNDIISQIKSNKQLPYRLETSQKEQDMGKIGFERV